MQGERVASWIRIARKQTPGGSSRIRSVKTAQFVKQLRDTATELQPLTHSASPNSATWDGMNYVKGEERGPDPYALAWWSILCTIADLLEAQEAPLSPKQIEYLRSVLFGGMGSLNDLWLKDADKINQRLEESRHRLWLSFEDVIREL
jgi:hypothetical protein